ncbi:MAG: hypothetical protein HQL52_04775 [Magnetococcales bacterium]|nr:hypothetical protein [Magnetococcales bacterium]
MDDDPRIVLTTCGRQLFRHPVAGLEEIGQRATHAEGKNPEPGLEQELDELVAQVKKRLSHASPDQAARWSPELNAIIRLYPKPMPQSYDRHILLHSDAWIDTQATLLIKEWLEERGFGVETRSFTGLRKGDPIALQRTLAHFTRWCGDILARYRLHQFHVIFNPTGGSRVLVGLMQTLAPFFADESAHLLEPGSDIVLLPMPKVRFGGEKTFQKHFYCLRRLALGAPPSPENSPEKLAGIPPELLIFDEQGVGLSFFGELLWEGNRRSAYGDSLLNPATDLIILSDTFRNATSGLERDRLQLLNERLDQLSIFLEQEGSTKSPAELSFRPVEDASLAPATYQCHGWTDKALWRLLGHFEGERFVMDNLSKKE